MDEVVQDYVNKAKEVVESLRSLRNDRGRPIPVVTTSKLRNLLSMTADIYNEVRLSRDDKVTGELKDRISYLKVRCLYEAGRDESVRVFVEKGDLLQCIDSIKTKQDYIEFSHYMEALVAWRKYLCSNDD